MDKLFLELISYIKNAKFIFIFHHVMPDYDTYGSSFAMYEWIKWNFPNKKIYFSCDEDSLSINFFKKYLKNVNKIQIAKKYEFQNALAITHDVSQYGRIFKNNLFLKCKIKIVIDHHNSNEDFFDLRIVNFNKSSTCEILENFFNFAHESNFEIPKKVAIFLYYGLLTDTSFFYHSCDNPEVFISASRLISCGVKPSIIYDDLLKESINIKKYKGYYLSNFKIYKKFGYAIFSNKILKKFNIKIFEAKCCINLLSHGMNINIYALAVENKIDNCWSISIRSQYLQINNIAKKYNGGGHKFAAGIKVKTIKEVKKIFKEYAEYSLTYGT